MSPRTESPHARRGAGFTQTVFSEFSALAMKHAAVNLGQGFPDFDGPPQVLEAAQRAIRDGVNQYAISTGLVALRRAIAVHNERFYGLAVDADTMVTVTSGATEALIDALLGLVDPGDEVVLFEPAYDCYAAGVTLAGGVAKYVTLRPPDATHGAWWYEPAELEVAFSARTKLVLLNTPHNPTGKVFTVPELEHLAALCERFDALLLSDEVYEHIVFSGARHVRAASVAGLGPRTLTVSSAGKTFSVTGWKVGWVIAPPKLRHAVQQVHQFVTFATCSPMQVAIAEALALEDGFFAELARSYEQKRDLLVSALEAAGLTPFQPQGSYFVIADGTRLGFGDDFALCRSLTAEAGVAAIPVSAFMRGAPGARQLARFAFCKTEPVLQEAARRLGKL